ncbi:MAG: glycosyltransferase family 4 protein [Thermoguttaceae bacterium]
MSSSPTTVVKRAARVFYREGLRGVASRVKARVRGPAAAPPPLPASSTSDGRAELLAQIANQLEWSRFAVLEETAAARFGNGRPAPRRGKQSLLMLIPEPERGSGGRTTMARVLRHLAARGTTCYVAFYPEVAPDRFADCRDAWFDEFGSDFCTVLPPAEATALDFDIAMATYWPGAYVVKNCISAASKGYFVQDFEPEFHAPGSFYAFAEETYRLGLWGVCASPWLASLLSSHYGMPTAGFLLGVDKNEYHLDPLVAREDNLVVAYIRRHTERRGYELLMWALKVLKDRMPGVRIEIFGDGRLPSDGGFLWIDKNHGILRHEQLRELYNRSAVGIVTSFTNYSLIPNEMMACGCAVVDLDTPCMRTAFPPGVVALERATPQCLAAAAESLLTDRGARTVQVRKGLEYISTIGWEQSLAAIEAAIARFSSKRPATL